MGFFGSLIGQGLGKIGENLLGKTAGIDGAALGGGLGGLLPFKTGGAVKKTGPALLHKGEFVLSPGLKPTAYQRKVVAANKRKVKAKARPRKTKK